MRHRIHLAVIRGPDTGWVADLGYACDDRPRARSITVGRSLRADLPLADAQLSRVHVRAHAGHGPRLLDSRQPSARRLSSRRPGAWVLDADSANGTRVGRRRLRPGRWRHVPVGGRIRIGGGELQVRTDAPAHHRRRGRGPGLLTFLPLIVSAMFLPIMLLGSGSRWPLLGLAGGGILTAVLGARRSGLSPPPGPPGLSRLGRKSRGSRPPDPAQLLRSPHRWQVPAPPPQEAERDHRFELDVGTACGVHSGRLLLSPGARVGLVGPRGGVELARWLSAQLQCRYQVTVRVEIRTADLRAPELSGGAGNSGTSGTSGTDSNSVLFILATDPHALPATCDQVLSVAGAHDRLVGAAWYIQVRRLGSGEATLPQTVLLRHHIELGADLWTAEAGLRAPVGVVVEAGHPRLIDIDLGGDNPHAVIAGTTGSGKSELLIAWLAGVASRYRPSDVSMVLVDYKGGAAFGPLTRLPHVIDVLTDLEPGHTMRALASLQVELQRRERLLRTSGAANLADHRRTCGPGERLGRLLVVVDEFRVLADQHPQILDELVRIAAQGRSLGIHIVLATQRPGGALNADMRANLGVRVCLRVVEDSDSLDMIGSVDAARLPAIAGRLILRTDTSRVVQGLWAGPAGNSFVDDVVRACRAAAAATPRARLTHRPWAPPLPDHVTADDLDAVVDPVAAAGDLALGQSPYALVDLPHEQRLGLVGVPVSTTLIAAGGPGSGRTTLARTIAGASLVRGASVHVVSAHPVASGDGVGTHVPPWDSVSVQALLRRIAHGTSAADSAPGVAGVAAIDVVILDDVAAITRTIDETCGPGAGAELLGEAVRGARHSGRGLVLTSDLPIPRWAQGCEEVLVLARSQPAQLALAEVPREYAVPGPAGRAVLLRAPTPRVVQIMASGPARSPDGLEPAFRIVPVPARVDLPLTFVPHLDAENPPVMIPAATNQNYVVIGLGGERAQPISLDLPEAGMTAVIGSAGAGTSRLLRVLAARLHALGTEPLAVGAGTEPPPGTAIPPGAGPRPVGGVVIVDDGDRLTMTDLDRLAAVVSSGAHLIVGLRAQAHGYHPLLQQLRAADQRVFVGAVPASAAGVALGPMMGRPRPGRAVLARGGTLVPVQLDWCSEVEHLNPISQTST